MELRTVALDHPDAQRLIEQLQREYVRRYGGEDDTPVELSEFAAPDGTFVLGYLDGAAVACGGWRACRPGLYFADGDVELKRMYVAPAVRGRGLSRLLLAELERRAHTAGRRRLLLECGTEQPEAIALYTSSGYTAIAPYGLHRCSPRVRCFAKVLPGGGTRCGAPLSAR